MKTLSPKSNFLFAALAILFTVATALAQDAPPKQDFADQPPEQQRPNLLRELGLSREQVQQLRRANQERKPLMDDATMRLRKARRELDAALYSDNLNEEDVRAKLREFQTAQADVAKFRVEGELTIRKVLTPDQFVRFLSLRQRFAQAGSDFRKQPRPIQNERQRMRQLRRQQQRQPPEN